VRDVQSTSDSVSEMNIEISSVIPANLRCEYIENPIGIDKITPRLSWILQTDRRGQKQTAYQVIVASSSELLKKDKGDLWDSKKTKSDKSNHIEYAGQMLKSRMQCFWKVRIWDKDNRQSCWSEPAMWTIGLLSSQDWEAHWISFPYRGQDKTSPMLRKEFNLTNKIRHAVLYLTARGLYEVRINGQRVGNHLLSPEWTSYGKRIQYQTYDVTELLCTGCNTIGAMLGEGWYAGSIQQWPPKEHLYGEELELLAQLEVQTENGKVSMVVSDKTWKTTIEGPILSSGIYAGETYDANKEQPGWDSSGFNDSKWKAVKVNNDLGQARLVAQFNEPICVTQEIKPVAVTEPKAGIYVFDLGQNMVGWTRVRFKAPMGTKIIFKHNERLNPDGTVYMDNLRAGRLSKELRRQTNEYICSGKGEEVFEPHFTYHGFRYVEVNGLKYQPEPDDLTGKVFHSNAPFAGQFECSDELLNRIWQNVFWSLRGNLMSVPTDCPQRDERMGWMGDAQIFCQTANFCMGMAAFWNKWIRDIRDDQLEDGQYPSYVPYPDAENRHVGRSAWADAGTIVPWYLYLNYADMRLLQEHFESARRWVDHICAENPNLISAKESHGVDHLNLGGTIPEKLFSTAFFARSTEIVARMAAVLGKDDEAREYDKLHEAIKSAFIYEFLQEDGKVTGDSQGAYALALAFDLVPENQRQCVAGHMIKALKKTDGKLTTGVVTTHHLLIELSRNGYHEDACRLVQSRQMPSWGLMVEQGATTIWERWDGYVPHQGLADSAMNSFNHFAFGAVGEWMMRELAGINLDQDHPGYKHFIIRPHPSNTITWTCACYNSIYGQIVSDWKLKGSSLKLNVTIPANTTATVYIPAKNTDRVTESGNAVAQAEGVCYLRTEGDTVVFKVSSGTYHFASE